mgnify:CR=1 FL=1
MTPDRLRRSPRPTPAWLLAVAAALLMLGPRPGQAQRAPVVTGTVVEAGTERPLAGADVTLRGLQSPDVLRRTTTGLDGTFRLPDPPRGTYVLRVQLLTYELP